MTLAYPSLAVVGALLALVPIVLHLVRRRRRVVQWAAIDFLLESDRRNRARVRLSELLLLAMRVVGVALVGLLAATPRSADLLEGWFGGDRSVHYVLLDDSASMAQRDQETSAWRQATDAIGRLERMAHEAGDELIVVRYADRLAGRSPQRIGASDEPGALPNTTSGWRVTNTAPRPDSGLSDLLDAVRSTPPGSRSTVTVLSDFAEATHPEGGAWEGLLREVAFAADDVVLADCGDPAGDNLSITATTLTPGPRASGVEATLRVEVTNFSADAADPVTVTLTRNGKPLTAVEIGPFEAGGVAQAELPITFAGVGLHVVEAALPGDRQPADDRRWMAIDLKAAEAVTLVDRSDSQREGRVFAVALRPRGASRSGWAPRVEDALSDETVAGVAGVVLLDEPRLSAEQVGRLRDHVRSGGGLLLVLGPQTDPDWFNATLGADASDPLTPHRIGPPASAPLVEAGATAIRAIDHPAVRILSGDRNGFLPLVRVGVRRGLATSPASVTPAVNTPASLAPGRLAEFVDGEPLLTESQYGDGRVLCLFTTAAKGGQGAPPWSNLATLPIFPVLVNDLVAWMAQERLRPQEEAIGVTPTGANQADAVLRRWDASGEMTDVVGLTPLAPAEPGVYQRVDAVAGQRPFAAYVDPAECDLRAPTTMTLRDRYGELATVARADDLFGDAEAEGSRLPLYAVALAVLVVLVIERWLALRCSYLTPVGEASSHARATP